MNRYRNDNDSLNQPNVPQKFRGPSVLELQPSRKPYRYQPRCTDRCGDPYGIEQHTQIARGDIAATRRCKISSDSGWAGIQAYRNTHESGQGKPLFTVARGMNVTAAGVLWRVFTKRAKQQVETNSQKRNTTYPPNDGVLSVRMSQGITRMVDKECDEKNRRAVSESADDSDTQRVKGTSSRPHHISNKGCFSVAWFEGMECAQAKRYHDRFEA